MWSRIGEFILRFRFPLLILLLAATAFMGWHASKVVVGYEFTRAIPTDNPKYQEYQQFRNIFGEEGNTMVVAVQTPRFFEPAFFNAYSEAIRKALKVPNVEGALSIPTALTLYTDSVTGNLKASRLENTDAAAFERAFTQLPFYRGALYNPATKTYLAAIRINKDTLNSKGRMKVIAGVEKVFEEFSHAQQVPIYYSGLPHIRTMMATQVESEMTLFIILSFVLTALILFLFFRSLLAVLASMLVVGMAVLWSVGTLHLCGFNITILTALIPPLIVVIGIPNCVYFLNKFHSAYAQYQDRRKAILLMVEKMGIVTLFTNLTAAIGFGVFFFTRSVLLKEFGLVAGLNLLAVFVISLIFLPIFLSLAPPPASRHTRYMEAGWINRLLERITNWVFHHRRLVYLFTALITIGAGLGMSRLRAETHIVDDLPKKDKVFQDLKFFERNFGGVMPLEILVDTRKKYGATSPAALTKINTLHDFIAEQPEVGHVLAISEGIKFAAQANAGGDSSAYAMPDATMLSFVGPFLRGRGGAATDSGTAGFRNTLAAFMDSTGRYARISASMADIGSIKLPDLLHRIRTKADEVFPPDKYTVTLTGTTPVFLEGSTFIIHSLRDSLVLAFIMILACMVLLFKSWRIVLTALIVNIIPLVITAGLMGWAGIPMKPSTVLVFSVALGIAVDVTIRFLVSYRQDLPAHNGRVADTVRTTIHETGLSIIYTSLILIAGFAVFCLSHFDGTKSLGYLTSLTLLVAMLTNLILQPALLLWIGKKQGKVERVKG